MKSQMTNPRVERQVGNLSFLLLVCLLWSFTTLGQTQNLSPGRKYTTVERLQPERLRAVQEARLKLERERKAVTLKTGLRDFRSIMHVHAEDSAHTGGTRPELLAAAKRTGVQIVMLTNHVRPPVDFINDSWRGLREGVLFIPGAESEGFLAYPIRSVMQRKTSSRDEYISVIKEGGGNIFLSHIEERASWPTASLTGMEIYNHHADFKTEMMLIGWLQKSLSDPAGIAALQEILKNYPLEFFGAQQDYLKQYIEKWDADGLTHRVTGVAANDCHHNQVIIVKVAAPDALELWLTGDKEPSFTVKADKAPRLTELTQGKAKGEVVASVDLDPYDRSLRYITTHILASKQTEAEVRAALDQAHAYVAHDWLCDPTGFAFIAENKSGKRIGVMGDEIALQPGLRLRLAAPANAIIKMYRDGKLHNETRGNQAQWDIAEPGNYRAEVWLEIDGEQRPWIYANALRVLTSVK